MPAKRKKGVTGKGAAKKATRGSASSPKGGTRQAAVSAARPEARDHVITRARAVELHTRHAGTRKTRGKPADGSVGGLFSKDAVMKLLRQKGTKYLRFYHATHEDGTPGIVLAASDADLGIVGGEEAMFLDDHHLCPPWCPGADAGLT